MEINLSLFNNQVREWFYEYDISNELILTSEISYHNILYSLKVQ